MAKRPPARPRAHTAPATQAEDDPLQEEALRVFAKLREDEALFFCSLARKRPSEFLNKFKKLRDKLPGLNDERFGVPQGWREKLRQALEDHGADPRTARRTANSWPWWTATDGARKWVKNKAADVTDPRPVAERWREVWDEVRKTEPQHKCAAAVAARCGVSAQHIRRLRRQDSK
jgi:hypothetical protein